MTEKLTIDPKVCLERSIETETDVIEDVIEYFDVLQTCLFIKDHRFSRVCLQFSDELLFYSASIYKEIRSRVDVDLYILGDTSYASCCVDEVAASHINADVIIHYGHSCFSHAVLPVFTVLPKKNIEYNHVKEALANANIDGFRICLFYDCSYQHLKDVLQNKWFQDYPEGYIAEIDIQRKGQFLGRLIKNRHGQECPTENLKECHCIYVGTRGQTFLNFAVSILAKQWHILDPSVGILELANETGWFKRRRYLVEKCRDASVVGILVCKLNGAETHQIIERIKNICKMKKNKSYIISVGKPNVAKLANFPEVDIYVLIACPENDLYNTRDMYKPIIYPFELEVAFNRNRPQYSEIHITNFNDILPGHKHYCEINEDVDSSDVSLITGKIRNIPIERRLQSNLQLAEKESWALENIGNNLGQRSWTGLEQKLGESEVKKAEKGRKGIALHYSNEPDPKPLN